MEDTNIRESKWFLQRLLVMAWTIVVVSFGMRYLDPALLSEEWMARLVLYSFGIAAVGEGVGKAIDSFSPKQFTSPPK